MQFQLMVLTFNNGDYDDAYLASMQPGSLHFTLPS